MCTRENSGIRSCNTIISYHNVFQHAVLLNCQIRIPESEVRGEKCNFYSSQSESNVHLFELPPTDINPLTPNDPYSGHTAPLNSKRCILHIYSTNRGTEHSNMLYNLRFFLFKMQFVS